MKKEFYEKILSGQGVYCAAAIKGGKVTHHFAESIDELIEKIDRLVEGNNNVFVAPNTFNGYSRKGDNAAYAKSFFIDLDVGDDPQKYASKDEALEALVNFVESSGLPIPVVIDSGNGIHAYWALKSDLPSAEWKQYAEKFKAYCMEHIKIDPSVTADVARIMRCPDTFNFKSDPPLPTRFLVADIEEYDLQDITKIVGEPNLTKSLASILGEAKKGLDEDTSSIYTSPNYETLFDQIVINSFKDDKGCKQIRYCIEHAATLPEPLWHSALSIARHCDDWEEAIHKLSEEYPAYDADETLRKANETYGKPHSCEVFASRNPQGCEGCPFKGKITNPLYFGKHFKEAEASDEPIEFDDDLSINPVIDSFPKQLFPYVRGKNGGIYIKEEEDEEGSAQVKEIWQHDFFPIKRMYDPQYGEILLMRHILPHDPPRDLQIPIRLSQSLDKVRDLVLSIGVNFKPKDINHMVNYINLWVTYMLNLKEAEQMRKQMGWTDDKDGFVIGNTEYRRDGTTKRTAASAFVLGVSKILVKEGSYDEWKRGAALMNKEGLELFCLPLLCGLGSPLIRFTPINGVSVCFTGGTGIGKSGSLFCGASLFGEPKKLSLSGTKRTSATDNALLQWMVNLKNIMMPLDEASNRPPEEVSDLIHKVSDGKSKLRMQASSDALRDIPTETQLIAFLTSNQSLIAKLNTNKANPDGELARLIDINYRKPQPFTDDPTLPSQIIEPMRLNHGHAGPDYIQYLFEVGDVEIQRRIEKWKIRFQKDFGHDTSYRYYDHLVSVSFAGGELAIERGIIDWDLERIYKVLLSHLKEQIEGTNKLNNVDYESILGEFQNQNLGGTIVVKDGNVIVEPKLALMARIEVDNRLYYVSTKILDEHLRKLQLDTRAFADHMKDKGILVGKVKKRLTDNWGGRSSTSAVHLYMFKEKIPDEIFVKNES
jgi:hypothetical protein